MISTEIQSAIEKLQIKTNKIKSTKLAALEVQLSDFLTNADPSVEDFFNLKKKCSELLLDKEFTYKRFSFFGLFKSRSEKLTIALQKELESLPLFNIAIQKLKENFPEEKCVSSLEKSLLSRNYSLADTIITENESLLQSKVPQVLAGLKKHLKPILAFSKLFKGTSIFTPKRHPVLEQNHSQRVYSLYELHQYMKQTKAEQTCSFIYAIDLNGNIYFSKDANASFHINLCNGKTVRGAGEIYLRKNKDKVIEVKIINNKSGLYLPTNEFLKPFHSALKQCDFNVKSSRLQDERTKLISTNVQDRMLFR
jgi:hypothetical protein